MKLKYSTVTNPQIMLEFGVKRILFSDKNLKRYICNCGNVSPTLLEKCPDCGCDEDFREINEDYSVRNKPTIIENNNSIEFHVELLVVTKSLASGISLVKQKSIQDKHFINGDKVSTTNNMHRVLEFEDTYKACISNETPGLLTKTFISNCHTYLPYDSKKNNHYWPFFNNNFSLLFTLKNKALNCADTFNCKKIGFKLAQLNERNFLSFNSKEDLLSKLKVSDELKDVFDKNENVLYQLVFGLHSSLETIGKLHIEQIHPSTRMLLFSYLACGELDFGFWDFETLSKTLISTGFYRNPKINNIIKYNIRKHGNYLPSLLANLAANVPALVETVSPTLIDMQLEHLVKKTVAHNKCSEVKAQKFATKFDENPLEAIKLLKRKSRK